MFLFIRKSGVRTRIERNYSALGLFFYYSGRRYIVPFQKLLYRIDPTGDMALNAFQGHLVNERESYLKLVPNPTTEAKSWD